MVPIECWSLSRFVILPIIFLKWLTSYCEELCIIAFVMLYRKNHTNCELQIH